MLVSTSIAQLADVESLFLEIGEGGVPIAEPLPVSTLADWLGGVGSDTEGMDARTRAAYLAGYVSWALGRVLAAFSLCGPGIPDLPLSAWRLKAERYEWRIGEDSGTALRFRVRLAVSSTEAFGPLVGDRRRRALLDHLHETLIVQLRDETGLSLGALRRLVADGLAAAWLDVGKRLGCAEAAMADILALIKHRDSALYNSKTGFVSVSVAHPSRPDLPPACDWYRARGGCCRYYTTPASAGSYCTTCVLRSPASRDQRLADYLRDTAFAVSSS
jgi:hypothetical protein